MRTACNMLRNEELNVSETADALHFNDIYTFSQLFKKEVGLSPKKYMDVYGKWKRNAVCWISDGHKVGACRGLGYLAVLLRGAVFWVECTPCREKKARLLTCSANWSHASSQGRDKRPKAAFRTMPPQRSFIFPADADVAGSAIWLSVKPPRRNRLILRRRFLCLLSVVVKTATDSWRKNPEANPSYRVCDPVWHPKLVALHALHYRRKLIFKKTLDKT